MGKKNVLEIYDEAYAQEYNQKFLLNEASKKNADFEEQTISNLLSEIGEGATWLDVACGTGYFLSRFPSVKRSGLDISPAMLKVAQQANVDVLFVQGDYRNPRPQWKNKWDLVTCMWWAYGYVESLSQLELVIENLADWTSEQGICFLPICVPEAIGAGNIKLPYSHNVAVYGGTIHYEGIIWSWLDSSEKLHKNMLAPQPEYLSALFEKYFDDVKIIVSPLSQAGQTTGIVARSKKQKEVPPTTVEIEIPTVSEFLSSFFKAIRSHDWWLYKIPPLLTIAYAEILLLNLSVLQSFLNVLALLFSIACVAAYGYIINDSFDIEVDRQVGKSNSMAQFSPWQRALFCLVLAGLGFLLPIAMNFSIWSITLLGINYLLPTLYSVPPFRFKEKGILGIISDAAGAHAIPTLFIATTFSHLVTVAPPQVMGLTISATAWSFFAGVRCILLHQIWDRENDLQAGIRTFVTQFELETVRCWINRFIFPCEIVLLGYLAIALLQSAPFLLGLFAVYGSVTVAQFCLTPISFNPSPPIGQNIILHDLYEVWLPLTLATLLATRNPIFLILLGLMIILFYPSIKARAVGFIAVLSNVLNFVTLTINKTPSNIEELEKIKRLQEQLTLKVQELKAQKLETLQAQAETDQHRESLQHFEEQAQKQIEQLQTQQQEVTVQLQHKQVDLHTTQTQLLQSQSQLQITQSKLTQSQSQFQSSQVELIQLKSYLKQSQGIQGLMDYYRHAIATHPDDLQLYDQALEIKSDDVQIYLQLGNALVKQGKLTDAIARYQTALQFHPDQFELHFELANTLEKVSQWDDAIGAYRRAIDLNPNHAFTHQCLGNVLADRGQLHEASASYRHALLLSASESERT
jgi:tetratricopeptide (TPR) repeat protein/4-hydroxybenzoate polyprenyltransferase